MKNWLGIEETEKGMRNSFLINKKPTEIEIYRIESLFEQIKEIVTTIETLLKELRSSGSKSGIKRQIEEETVRLFSIYESLKEMIRDSEGLQEPFILGIANIKKSMATILEEISQLPTKF